MAKNSIASPVEDWEVEDALRTLIRAKEIQKDPKLLAKVQALAKKKMLDVAAVASDTDD
jgi:hypothetical protein